MSVNRRKFFGALAAAPAAAKAAAQQAALAVSGGMHVGSAMPTMGFPGSEPSSQAAYDRAQSKMLSWVRSGNLPEWKRRELRRYARFRSKMLDPDLMTMRSLSDVSRHRIQLEREIDRQITEFIEDDESRNGFKSLLDSFTDKISPFR